MHAISVRSFYGNRSTTITQVRDILSDGEDSELSVDEDVEPRSDYTHNVNADDDYESEDDVPLVQFQSPRNYNIEVIRSLKKYEDKEMELQSSGKEYSEREEEGLRHLCKEMLKEIWSIKEGQEKTNAEIRNMRVDISKMNEKREEKFKKLGERIYNLEKRMDSMEKEKKNIKRQEVNGGKIAVNKQVEKMLKNKMVLLKVKNFKY
ncbi:hypothetical protein FQR65_LT02982 [Abscondita terminalis]|nr:hypothetical protein FQR65_LT02982 [Abscondita terminalis]